MQRVKIERVMVHSPPPVRHPAVFKGGSPFKGGRRKGKGNIYPRVLKEAVLVAAEQVGFNRKGQDGLVGYLKRLAIDEPKSFTVLLARILPLQVAGTPNQPLRIIAQGMSPHEAGQVYAETVKLLTSDNPVIEGEVVNEIGAPDPVGDAPDGPTQGSEAPYQGRATLLDNATNP